MSDLGGFFAMGGYAAYVWPAYGLALAVLGGLTAHSWLRYRQSVIELAQLQRDRGPRR
jgi:heme exporter protein D